MTLYAIDGKPEPELAAGAWVAASAEVMGHVVLHADANVWYQAVLRGDNDPIIVGARSNVQDAAIIHTDDGVPCRIGEGVTIGHQAMLHGCTIEDDCLIGIGATVLNGAVIGAGSLIGAHALVPEGKQIPPGSLVLGAPGKVVKPVSDILRQVIQASAHHYVDNAKRHRRMRVLG